MQCPPVYIIPKYFYTVGLCLSKTIDTKGILVKRGGV